MPRSFYEPIEPEDIFDREEAQERRARIDAARERNDAVAAQEAAQDAKRRETSRQFSLRNNQDQICAQYRAAGVEPLEVNGNGVPTVSLSMLLSIGWTIRDIDGQKTLLEPLHVAKRKEPDDQNS